MKDLRLWLYDSNNKKVEVKLVVSKHRLLYKFVVFLVNCNLQYNNKQSTHKYPLYCSVVYYVVVLGYLLCLSTIQNHFIVVFTWIPNKYNLTRTENSIGKKQISFYTQKFLLCFSISINIVFFFVAAAFMTEFPSVSCFIAFNMKCSFIISMPIMK